MEFKKNLINVIKNVFNNKKPINFNFIRYSYFLPSHKGLPKIYFHRYGNDYIDQEAKKEASVQLCRVVSNGDDLCLIELCSIFSFSRVKYSDTLKENFEILKLQIVNNLIFNEDYLFDFKFVLIKTLEILFKFNDVILGKNKLYYKKFRQDLYFDIEEATEYELLEFFKIFKNTQLKHEFTTFSNTFKEVYINILKEFIFRRELMNSKSLKRLRDSSPEKSEKKLKSK